jgi:RluA family pseudouridine synthase
MTIEIIYQDASVLVVNKPAGLPVLPDGWEKDSPYLVKQLEAEYSKVWVVHRLDKITSGVMVFARTAAAHRALNMQFEKHAAQKTYQAIVNGNPKWDEHTAKHPLRVNVGHSHRTVVDHSKGKPSETHFRVLQRYQSHGLIEAEPRTGRTHQIRVHLYALGHPILADILYSAPATDLIARPALHASTLALVHPESKLPMTFTAPYPADFAQAIHTLSTL